DKTRSPLFQLAGSTVYGFSLPAGFRSVERLLNTLTDDIADELGEQLHSRHLLFVYARLDAQRLPLALTQLAFAFSESTPVCPFTVGSIV
ncbi:MAG: hypothetical protein ACRDRL_17355, partial [Sciscionella sp.]